MKNALTPSQGTAAVSEPWRAALRTFDADLRRRGAAELAAWATANGLSPTDVGYPTGDPSFSKSHACRTTSDSGQGITHGAVAGILLPRT